MGAYLKELHAKAHLIVHAHSHVVRAQATEGGLSLNLNPGGHALVVQVHKCHFLQACQVDDLRGGTGACVRVFELGMEGA